MSQRNRREFEGAAAAGSSHQNPELRRVRRWWPVIAVLGAIALSVAATLLWLTQRSAARIEHALPPVPELAGRPPLFRELVANAHADARSIRGGDRGVAELGRLYHANAYYAEARACWEILHAADPREPRWCYYLADLRRTASDYAAFTALLEQTAALAPDYAPAWLHLAGLRLKSGRIDAAGEAYQKRLALLPGDPHARLGLARIARQRQQPDETRRLLELIVRETPDFPTSHNLYAEMLAAEGDASGARRHRWLARQAGRFREAADPWLNELDAWCYEPDRLIMLGTVEFQTERHPQARAYFEKAVQLAPEDPGAHELLGELYLKQGDAAKAREALEHSLRLPRNRPPPATLFVNLSQAHRDLQQPAEALRVAEAGLAVVPDAFELHSARGVALADLDRHEEAIAAYRQALARQPADADANYNLAISLLIFGRADEAHAQLRQALTLQPTFPKALSLLGRMELDIGDWRAAEAYLRPLFEAYPETPASRQLLAQCELQAGRAAAQQNDFATAEARYRAGLELAPEDPDLNVSLGVLYLTQARASDALAPLETYRQLKTADPAGTLLLGQAYAQLGRIPDARRVLTEGEQQATRAGMTDIARSCREILDRL